MILKSVSVTAASPLSESLSLRIKYALSGRLYQNTVIEKSDKLTRQSLLISAFFGQFFIDGAGTLLSPTVKGITALCVLTAPANTERDFA